MIPEGLAPGASTWTVLAATSLFGAAAGAVGAFALLRRRALFADTMGHATLPGVALAFLTATALGLSPRSSPVLLAGAALGAAVVLWLGLDLLRRTRLDSDAVIGSLGGAAFGLGLVLTGLAQDLTTAETAGLDHLIFGSASSLVRGDALAMALLAAAALAVLTGLGRRFATLAFDEPFARATGLRPARLDAVLLVLLLVVTLSGLRAVGMILVVAMLVLPAVAASLFTHRLPTLVALATALGAVCAAAGTLASSAFERVPTGPAIVLAAAAPAALGFLAHPERGLLGGWLRQRRLRARALDELAAERSGAAPNSARGTTP